MNPSDPNPSDPNPNRAMPDAGRRKALGCLAAWPVVTRIFKAEWAVDWSGVALLVLGAAVLAALGGLLATLHALAKRPAAALRTE